jgi:ABC-2 type transport system permease protein
VIGVVLIFLMLTQYNTWILMGVMQEKASRVVEVLLAAVRPIQLLGGKVLGIGLVAMGQAALIVAFAFVVGKAVGSDLLKGTGGLLLLADLLWLVLGYAFYSWLYAAAGSTAERQDQVQTLALPLSLPILIAYIYSITVASSGNPSTLFKALAYFPPTAPFAMPVLVSLNAVAWWQFLISVVLSIVGTALMAWFAAGIYRRAVLRSGQRVSLRELRSHSRSRGRGQCGGSVAGTSSFTRRTLSAIPAPSSPKLAKIASALPCARNCRGIPNTRIAGIVRPSESTCADIASTMNAPAPPNRTPSSTVTTS